MKHKYLSLYWIVLISKWIALIVASMKDDPAHWDLPEVSCILSCWVPVLLFVSHFWLRPHVCPWSLYTYVPSLGHKQLVIKSILEHLCGTGRWQCLCCLHWYTTYVWYFQVSCVPNELGCTNSCMPWVFSMVLDRMHRTAYSLVQELCISDTMPHIFSVYGMCSVLSVLVAQSERSLCLSPLLSGKLIPIKWMSECPVCL